MEPKFQSSFIPKGPASSAGVPVGGGPKVKERNLFSFIASLIFIISIVLALGVFGYKFYLKYAIGQMETDLEQVYVSLEPETLREIIRLDQQIKSTDSLISSHIIVSPFFEFLQENTPPNVRFTEFRFESGDGGYEVNMMGEASSYASLALLADLFGNSSHFRTISFSDFNLTDQGNVSFSMQGTLDHRFLSYERKIQNEISPVVPETDTSLLEVFESGASTSTTSTSTTSTATSTATSTIPAEN
ncbi:MAG: PilN domain-containing protein [Parcubacteria group bacterium]